MTIVSLCALYTLLKRRQICWDIIVDGQRWTPEIGVQQLAAKIVFRSVHTLNTMRIVCFFLNVKPVKFVLLKLVLPLLFRVAKRKSYFEMTA